MQDSTMRRRASLATFLAGTLAASLALVTTPTPADAATHPASAAISATVADGGSIDARDRAEVIAGYNSRWVPAYNVAYSWTGGDVSSCKAGTPSAAVVQANLQAVNYVRDQVGVAPVVLNTAGAANAQLAALMMEANWRVSHGPDRTWKCWSAGGAQSAARSNLVVGPNHGTVAGVSTFLDDWGPDNIEAGHRRHLLDAGRDQMAFGLTPQASAIDLTPGPGAVRVAATEAVTWPSAGYFPEGLLPGSGRWSYSTYDSDILDRNLNEASVSVSMLTRAGAVNLPVNVEYRHNGDIVFIPSGVKTPTAAGDDVTYRVRISGVRTMMAEPAPDIEYTTTLVPHTQAYVWTQKPSVSATPVAGEPITVSPGTYTPSGSGETVEYTWFSRGEFVGTGATYTPGFSDVGHPLSVETKIRTRSGATGAATLTHTASVTYQSAPKNTRVPTLSGDPQTGQTLSVSTGSWDPKPASYAFQWYRNNQPIAGARAATYTVDPDDVDFKIHALVTAFAPNGTPGFAASSSVTISQAPQSSGPRVVEFPTLSGVYRVGQSLRVDPGVWYSATGYTYQWHVNNVPVPGATASTFTLPPGSLMRKVYAVVTASNASGRTTAARSDTSPMIAAGLAPTPTGALKLRGPAKVGKKLAVTVPAFTPAPAEVRIQWLRNGKVVKARTGRVYRLSRADKGKKISVRVTTVRPAYLPRVLMKATSRVR